MRVPPGPPMSLANMRQNGIRSVIASCANCGRSADVNVDTLPETLTVPKTALSREPNLARAKIGSPNSGSGCGSSSPRLESFFSEDAERAAGSEMALDVESVVDDGVNGQEALS